MLGRGHYPKSQIDACRAEMAAVAACWRAVAAHSEPNARGAAEEQVFNQLVVALEGWFVHRLRGTEGKDGNALNEVRLLALGVTEGGGCFPNEPGIKWRAEASVTGYRAGDRIRMTEVLFGQLCTAYLDLLGARYAAA